ncbi:MAG: hypothetical protein HKN62_14000 [Phycisphaerales bacterium]|nr:hypothetical protein [Phycisphaerales bacterium]
MLIAEIRRKLSNLETLQPSELTADQLRSLLRETKEDLLTADVFGGLKYLPRTPYLTGFLEEIASSNPTATSFHQHVDELKAGLDDLQFVFWPSYATPAGINGAMTEPDVALIGDDALLLIEAKLYSGFGALQVERELAVAIAEARDRPFHVVLVTRHLAPPRFRLNNNRFVFSDYIRSVQPSAEIAPYLLSRLQQHADRVLWIGWHRIARSLERAARRHEAVRGNTDPEVRRSSELLSDLLELMDMRGIRPFRGLGKTPPAQHHRSHLRPVLAGHFARPPETFGGIRAVLPLFIRQPLAPWLMSERVSRKRAFAGFDRVARADLTALAPRVRLGEITTCSGNTRFGSLVRAHSLAQLQLKPLQGAWGDHTNN